MLSESSDSDIARRCSVCGISWPRRFSKCYECGGPTDLYRGDGPTITEEEAESKKNHFLFDEYSERTGRK